MKNILGIIAVFILLLGGVYISNQKNSNTLGSISSSGDAYIATSTNSSWNTPAATTGGFKLLKTGQGILGSVVITNDTAGSYTLYDATTTTNGAIYGTTTLANVYANLSEGTYTFDVAFSRGLIVEFQSPNVASSTITFK